MNFGKRHWNDHLPLRGRWLDMFVAAFAVPVAFFAILAACTVLASTLDVPGHNLRLGRLEQRVSEGLAHPAGSRLILRRKIVDNLGGTGNQCHFAVVELREGGGSPDSLRRFYAGKQLKDPDTGEILEVQLRLSPIAPDDQIGAVDPITRLITAAERKGADYAIAAIGWSEPGCDFRCE